MPISASSSTVAALPDSNHLIPTPSESRARHCAKFFPGIDMHLMHEWWVYVDEGGSIAAEDVAFAIQYAVMYQFLKYVDHLHTRQEAREYIIYGVTAEAEYINSHKGTYPETEKESYDIALTALLEAFDQSSAYAAYSYDSMTSSFSSYMSSS